jgi:hypothetical protein
MVGASARARGGFSRSGCRTRSDGRHGHGRGAQGDVAANLSRERLNEIGDRAAQLVIFEIEKSVDRPATMVM